MKASRAGIFDIITAVFVVLTVGVAAMIVLIINDPNTPLNPFPPPTNVPLIALPTLTPSATVTATSTATATATATGTATATSTATATATATDTPTPTTSPTPVLPGMEPLPPVATTAPLLDDGSGNTIIPTDLPTAQAVPPTRAPFPFVNEPVYYEANTNAQGCQWLSIAGTVAGLSGEPLAGLAIELVGENYRQVFFSGSAAAWGVSGFEFQLGSAPRTASYTLQMLGPTGGPVSDKISIETGNTCQTNVAIVELVQNHPY